MSTQRRLAIVLVALTAAGSGCALTSSTAVARPPVAAPGATAKYTMRFRVLNALPETVTVRDKTLEKGHWRNSGPADMKGFGTADFVLESESNQGRGTTRWRIGTTSYLLAIYGDAANGYANCSIQDLNGRVVTGSPYQCALHQQKGNDTDTYVVLEPRDRATTTLYDGNLRRLVWEGICGDTAAKDTGYGNCDYDIKNINQHAAGEYHHRGDIIVNCGATAVEQKVGFRLTTTETDTVGGSIGLEYGSPANSLKLSLDLQKQWVKSRSWSESTAISVPAHEYGWVDVAAPEQVVTAAVTITAGNQTYLLPVFNVSAPRNSGPALTRSRSRLLPNDYCSNPSPSVLPLTIGAPPIESAAVYALGLDGANQHVITATSTAGIFGTPLSFRSWGEGPRFLWQFQPIGSHPGFYRLRSDSNLDWCLTQNPVTAATELAPCTASAAGLVNQLWQPQWNPAGTAFALKSAHNGKVIGLSATNTFQMVNDNAQGVRTLWQLNHVG